MISREEAIKIAEKHHGPGFELYRISHGLPNNCAVYRGSARSWAPDDVWCVSCLNHPGKHHIATSSLAIVIHKETGEILYGGDAGDEG